MKRKIRIIKLGVPMICCFSFVSVAAQSGGDFALTQTVIAGGGNSSAGGDFTVDSTSGQAVAGRVLRHHPFALTSGFWNFTPVGPTAAQVSISGRVTTAYGHGIGNARMTLISSDGQSRSAVSSALGYYEFTNVAVGETYIISISAKRYTFAQPTIVRTVFDEITDLDFVADYH